MEGAADAGALAGGCVAPGDADGGRLVCPECPGSSDLNRANHLAEDWRLFTENYLVIWGSSFI